MKDKYERKIEYLRISVTDRCNLRCRYCMPQDGISDKKSHDDMLSLEEIYEVVKVCASLGMRKVRITGGEPLTRKGVSGLIKNINKIDSIKDIAITTNGIQLKEKAKDLKESGLKRVNISLDTLDAEKYKYITRFGSLKDVLEGIDESKKVRLLPIKINTVLIGGFNDDEIEDFVNLTVYDDIHVRFIELMPIGQASEWAKEKFVSNTLILDRFNELKPIPREDESSPAVYYKLPGAKGTVGLINPISHHFCKNCNRIRLTADGKIKPCLHSNQEIDVKEALRSGKDIRVIVESAIKAKPQRHHINEGENVKRDMMRIGG
ncbi:MAG: GTP 3',8-cyclase MoaA [Clostridiales bacterium]|nr:GTP 3',8-cyclase MoaA [Clostridiales bacterium]